ncbi:MAG: RNA polymerase sigma factor [Sporichthyaceae bacterium]
MRQRRSPERSAASPAEDPDAALTAAVAAAAQGDEGAFVVVYRTLAAGLVRYLGSIVGAEAEDVAGDAWLQIARDLPTFSGDGRAFRAWSATIARNRALDHLRRAKSRPVLADLDLDLAPEQAAVDDVAALVDERLGTERALALIARLPRDQAEAVLLRVVVGLDAQAAADVLGKKAGAVRTCASRGLARLAAILAEQPGVTEIETHALKEVR